MHREPGNDVVSLGTVRGTLEGCRSLRRGTAWGVEAQRKSRADWVTGLMQIPATMVSSVLYTNTFDAELKGPLPPPQRPLLPLSLPQSLFYARFKLYFIHLMHSALCSGT